MGRVMPEVTQHVSGTMRTSSRLLTLHPWSVPEAGLTVSCGAGRQDAGPAAPTTAAHCTAAERQVTMGGRPRRKPDSLGIQGRCFYRSYFLAQGTWDPQDGGLLIETCGTYASPF